MRPLLFLLLSCFASLLPAAEPAWRGAGRHVVVLVVDGPRWSETWGHQELRYIPERAKLKSQGAWYANFQNTGWTYTNCGHTAITTGFYEQIENQGNQLPAHPSWFQVWRELTGAPAEQTWIVSAKDKLHILADTVDPTWKGRAMPSHDCGNHGPGSGYRDDQPTQARVLDVLKTHHPALVLVNYRGPDSQGHAANWNGYVEAIRETDRYVVEVWQSIQADPAMRDRTNLFITNDHGRHVSGTQDDFVNHGCPCTGCRHIELLAMGPDIVPGAVIDQERNQIDLAATIAWLIGVELPGSTGQVMRELLRTK